MINSVVYISGSDGSGKTTILNDIGNELRSQSNQTRHIWIRSPKILSKPLMAYCWLVGLTKYKTINGVKYGKHEFYRSNFVSWLFPILQLVDFKIKWYFEKKKIKSGEVLLLDRFSLDTLADLMVDTKRMNLHKTWIGKAFIDIIPENTRILILKVKEDVIRNRKRDTLYDEQLTYKIDVYNILCKDLKINEIDNNRIYKAVINDVFGSLGINERN